MSSHQTCLSKSSRNNIVLLFCLIVLALITLPFALKSGKEGTRARIEIDGQEYSTVRLDEDTEFTIETPAGVNTVTVTNHEISVKSADCPDKICVNHAPIHKSGEVIVCLPHKLVITIISDNSKESEDSHIDAVAE